jgi:hypothetical protein
MQGKGHANAKTYLFALTLLFIVYPLLSLAAYMKSFQVACSQMAPTGCTPSRDSHLPESFIQFYGTSPLKGIALPIKGKLSSHMVTLEI